MLDQIKVSYRREASHALNQLLICILYTARVKAAGGRRPAGAGGVESREQTIANGACPFLPSWHKATALEDLY